MVLFKIACLVVGQNVFDGKWKERNNTAILNRYERRLGVILMYEEAFK